MKSGIGVKEHLPWLQQLPLDLLAQPPATYSKLDTKHLLPFGGFMLSFTQALKSGWARRYADPAAPNSGGISWQLS